MSKRRDYYKILHVQPGAPEEVIRASYLALMKACRMHPDLGGDHMTATLINEAFETLANPASRSRYDEFLRTSTATGQEAETREDHLQSQTSPAWETSTCAFCATPCGFSAASASEAVCPACDAPLCRAQQHAADGESRRAIERLPRNMRVTFRRAGPDRSVYKGISQDLSPSGMRFLTRASVAVNDRIMVNCEFCAAVGIVRSVRTFIGTPAFRECGIQFVTLRVKRDRGGLLSSIA